MNHLSPTPIRSYRAPGSYKPVDLRGNDKHTTAQRISAFMDGQDKLGIEYSNAALGQMMSAYQHLFASAPGKPRGGWMDAAPTPTFNPSTIGNAIQFLQEWFPGVIGVNTAARKITDLVGMTNAGRWEQEEVVFRVAEPTGAVKPYTDKGVVPLADFNTDFERRTIYRGEMGFDTGILAQERAALSGWEYISLKRQAVAAAMGIQLNAIGFYGVAGQNVGGFLTDSGLPAYVTVAVKAQGGTSWLNATQNEIITDIITAATQLRTQSGETVDPEKDRTILALPTNKVDQLSKTNQLSTVSVKKWLVDAYPMMEVISVPELQTANAGQDVFYLYSVQRGKQTNIQSTDGNAVWHQVVPTVDRLVGVQPMVKGVLEDHSFATAGTICVAPYCVVRYTGI